MLRSRPRSATGSSADAVMLEADVMRFMAILAFCLMVVFALIQAIPPSRPDPGVKLDSERLQRERHRAAAAEAEVARLERRLAAATAAEDTAPQADDGTLDAQAAMPSASPPAVDPAQPAAAEPEPSSPPAAQPPERAYTLRFDSTEAIRALVRDGRVELYAELGGRLWRARRSLAFESAAAPEASYELTDSPGRRLEQGFRRSAGMMSARSPRWLVDFDPRLLGEIRNALGSAAIGADIVIEQNGRVRVDAAVGP